MSRFNRTGGVVGSTALLFALISVQSVIAAPGDTETIVVEGDVITITSQDAGSSPSDSVSDQFILRDTGDNDHLRFTFNGTQFDTPDMDPECGFEDVNTVICTAEGGGALAKVVVLTGAASDTITADGVFTLAMRVEAGVDEDEVIGGAAADTLVGGDGVDNLQGQGGGDRLLGGTGGDTLKGGAGADRLFGQDNADTLVGGGGKDVLSGGGGRDIVKALDQRRGDEVDCGIARDSATADKGDTVKGCEQVRRG